MIKYSGAILLTILMAAGCRTLPVHNKPLETYSADYGYRYRNINPGADDSDNLLVILTFSGGGTRAASLSYGVLCVLRDTQIFWQGRSRRLLDEVDVISSVSGGSLTAAYYALFGDRIFEDFPKRVLYRDIQGNLLRSLLAPANLIKLVSPFYGRTDLMGDNFSDWIFEHKTYGDLLARNRRPYIIINTTDMSRGSRLGFTQGQFDLFYSDLNPYPIGNAVAASAAFPGLLAPMTLRNFPKPDDFQPPAWLADDQNAKSGFIPDDQSCYLDKRRTDIYVIDGGVSDNLGLLPIIMGIDGHHSDDKIGDGTAESLPKKVIIITVNAEGRSKRSWELSAGLPGLIDTLLTSGTAPLGNFSHAQIGYLRQQIAYRNTLKEIKQQVEQQATAQGVSIQIPALEQPDIDFYFIEVAFNQIASPEKRNALSRVPTNFNLGKKKVDAVCGSAKEILAANPDFQAMLATLQPPGVPSK
ncbi:MAG TPA: patatin-like phospholipase family protein [Candidatus Hydrogenedentes bacterium]|nr:patatin-like phospholipase family protein [Candidatus Hydrogenedentota bacterium]